MSAEEFDRVYYELARCLGAAEDAVLVRDRLIITLLQRLDPDDAVAAIGAAALPDGLDPLKRGATR